MVLPELLEHRDLPEFQESEYQELME